MKTIQERLRSPKPTVSRFGGLTGREPSPLELLAADEIDHLQAQVGSFAAELRAEIEVNAVLYRERDEARVGAAQLAIYWNKLLAIYVDDIDDGEYSEYRPDWVRVACRAADAAQENIDPNRK
jgi:hypothetical protein